MSDVDRAVRRVSDEALLEGVAERLRASMEQTVADVAWDALRAAARREADAGFSLPLHGLPVVTGPDGQQYLVDPSALLLDRMIPRSVLEASVEEPAHRVRFSLVDRVTPLLRTLALSMVEFGGSGGVSHWRLSPRHRILARRKPQRPAYPSTRHRR